MSAELEKAAAAHAAAVEAWAKNPSPDSRWDREDTLFTVKKLLSADAYMTVLAERDGLRRSLADTEAALERALDPKLMDLRASDGRLDMAMVGASVQRMSLAFVEWFRHSQAENYIEMGFSAQEEPFERYTLTVQKVGAQTPAEKTNAAVERAEKAEALNAALLQALTRIRDLDEADGHDLTWKHASEAVGIASEAIANAKAAGVAL